jgi:outer membrane protein, multidrug efflux system
MHPTPHRPPPAASSAAALPTPAPARSTGADGLRARSPLLAGVVAAALLAGCASAPAPDSAPPARPAPPQWQAPLPHAGQPAELQRWWQQFDDPTLARLLDAAQANSTTVASARSRVEQARATAVSAGAALGPEVSGSATAGRGKQDLRTPLATSVTAGLQASWEIDLFGGLAAGREAARARLDGAEAAWHDARVSIAAETAGTYLQLRTCEAQRALAESDAGSREQSRTLTELSARAGFQAPSAAALARASAAQGRALANAQAAQCDRLVKSLVALTAAEEPALRALLAGATGRLPQPAPFAIQTLPADLLAQRPDLRGAERDLVAALAEVRQTDADRLPRVALTGSLGVAAARSVGETFRGTTWTFGPVSVTLPLLDGGARAARSDAARARADEAQALYLARVRSAVREVEDALVQLASTASRTDDARIAAEGFEASFRAAEARQQGGLASLFELEDARRTALAANTALLDLQRERIDAWISLYRAAGGGWTPSAAEPPAPAAPQPAADPARAAAPRTPEAPFSR